MIARKAIFPNVIELNFQAAQVLGCCVYLVFDGSDWLLIDIGLEDTVEEIVELIRQMDFPLSKCKMLIATHADVDHVQGMNKAKQLLKAPVYAHPRAVEPLETGNRLWTFARIEAQNIDMDMPPLKIDGTLNDGDKIEVGGKTLEVWLTPGHTDSQLAFRLGNILFSGDNIYRDGSVGAIDAHHGSDIGAFIQSLTRIRNSDVKWLLPSHGPYFRKDNGLLDRTIARLETYSHMADFGTCAVDWPLMDEWEQELTEGKRPN
jgi:glyoxylase-like metal-dependent hydrolase (beta-lactamase superfamily II)